MTAPDLPARLRACVTLSSAYRLLEEGADEVERLRALLLKSYCYVAAHVPIGVKTDNDRKVLMLDIDAALREKP